MTNGADGIKSCEAIAADLARMETSHYYSEDYELEWAAKSYFDTLTVVEQERFIALMQERLSQQAGMADIAICARLQNPALTLLLADRLNEQEVSSSTSRALLAALSHQADEAAYSAVERFIDSELEGEALMCMARMNFQRALPHLQWALKQDHLHNFCLHAMHEYMRREGMDALLSALRSLVALDRDRLTAHLRKVMGSKQGPFNPFTATELDIVAGALTL